ncbi:carboxymuconolactone decarboxylase family protein [Cellulomonas sp. McL0617]|uniref:carboxymuconolactone decarboxylase family protein n=1 Tax=Cellulomonas sp. McL0617 TaxID=3415675 RepID=UPI003CF1B2E3
MSRAPRLVPAALDEAQRAVYDAVAGGPRAQGPALFRLVDPAGALEGPFNAFLLQPGLGMALQELGAAVRYGTTFTDRAREIAILVVAVHHDSAFEWYAHEAVGRHAGLTDAELDALRAGDVDSLPYVEQVVARTTRLLLESRDLDDDAFTTAVDALGLPQVFELLTLVGYYETLALQLRVLRVAAPVD